MTSDGATVLATFTKDAKNIFGFKQNDIVVVDPTQLRVRFEICKHVYLLRLHLYDIEESCSITLEEFNKKTYEMVFATPTSMLKYDEYETFDWKALLSALVKSEGVRAVH
jgi:hypothetical protein